MRTRDSTVPRLGLGTWQNADFEQCKKSVRIALDVGYRHIDTAENYDNERAVGAGIEAASVDRADVFLATKILHPFRVEDELTRKTIRTKADECLSRLDVDAVDLLYVHWPSDYDLELVHATLAELRDEGRVGDVGVSNYKPEHLDEALATDPDIVANQVELHPIFPQAALREYCAERGVDVVGYAPLAHGEVFDVPELVALAAELDASVARVVLAWLRQKGVAAVPKATSAAHIRDNWASLDVDLSDSEIEAIDAIERTERLFSPDYAPAWE